MIQRVILISIISIFVSAAAMAQPAKKLQRAAGQVDAVSKETVTLMLPGNNKIVVRVDKATKIVGRGLEGRTAAATADGLPAVEQLVKPADAVVVTYSDVDGEQLAKEIHVRIAAKT